MIALPFRTGPKVIPMNACRFRGAPGHVESYFLRANDPSRARALWLKATILAPNGTAEEHVAETWLIWFDGEKKQTVAEKRTHPLATECFQSQADGVAIRIGDWSIDLGGSGGSATGRTDRASFELRFTRPSTSLARPLSILPFRFLEDAPIPRSKLLTPYPWLRFSGSVVIGGERVSLDGWDGMQGHNWGKEHAFEYAWGQCLFPAADSQPEAMVEGFSGRLQVGGRTSPLISAVIVRRGEEEYRFDTLVDLWRQEAYVSEDRWTLRLKNRRGEVRLRMDRNESPMACLGYRNPDGSIAYCHNTKLAAVHLEVHSRGGASFIHRSERAGALELLKREHDAGLEVI